ncbi:MAG: hypothetical protein AABY15_01000 [Nanoarchaeota archaeon]
MNIKKKMYCSFCEVESRIQSNGANFCINGHFIVIEGKLDMLQPKSEGNNVVGKNVYRLNNLNGDLCDDKGDLIVK